MSDLRQLATSNQFHSSSHFTRSESNKRVSSKEQIRRRQNKKKNIKKGREYRRFHALRPFVTQGQTIDCDKGGELSNHRCLKYGGDKNEIITISELTAAEPVYFRFCSFIVISLFLHCYYCSCCCYHPAFEFWEIRVVGFQLEIVKKIFLIVFKDLISTKPSMV